MGIEIYVKSLMWLIGLGGLGYGLMLITEPSQSKINKIKERSKANFSEEEKKKILFLEKLKQATEDRPVNLQKKKDE